MSECHNCGQPHAEYDCNGLKFCDWECFKEWDTEEQASLDRFAAEYKAFYIDGIRDPDLEKAADANQLGS